MVTEHTKYCIFSLRDTLASYNCTYQNTTTEELPILSSQTHVEITVAEYCHIKGLIFFHSL